MDSTKTSPHDLNSIVPICIISRWICDVRIDRSRRICSTCVPKYCHSYMVSWVCTHLFETPISLHLQSTIKIIITSINVFIHAIKCWKYFISFPASSRRDKLHDLLVECSNTYRLYLIPMSSSRSLLSTIGSLQKLLLKLEHVILIQEVDIINGNRRPTFVEGFTRMSKYGTESSYGIKQHPDSKPFAKRMLTASKNIKVNA